MTEEEVFKIVRQHLIEHFPYYFNLFALMCYEPGCTIKDCHACWFHRVYVSPWEMTCIMPELEKSFGKRCSLKQPEFYEVIKFFADN